MSTDGPTEKIPTTPPGTGDAADTTTPTATYPAQPDPSSAADPLAGFGSSTASGPARDTVAEEPAPVRRGVRVGTFVWGLVIVAVGVGVFALSAGYALDVELALIVLLGAAGAAMLVGSLLKGRRAGRR